jgi:hypothetical protein
MEIPIFVTQIPTDFSSLFQNQNRKHEGGNPDMEEDLLYSRSPGGGGGEREATIYPVFRGEKLL